MYQLVALQLRMYAAFMTAPLELVTWLLSNTESLLSTTGCY
jgi:hypothetical protein